MAFPPRIAATPESYYAWPTLPQTPVTIKYRPRIPVLLTGSPSATGRVPRIRFTDLGGYKFKVVPRGYLAAKKSTMGSQTFK
jgi:hypothetical protein